MRTASVCVLALIAVTGSAAAQGLSSGDRQRLIAHLEMDESWLVSEIDGLEPEQLKFRPGHDSWSIMDVLEHLAVAEPQYWRQLQDSMKQPPAQEKTCRNGCGYSLVRARSYRPEPVKHACQGAGSPTCASRSASSARCERR